MRRELRHNVAALGADYALFVVGLAFASQSTILPAFAAHLGAPNVVIGAILMFSLRFIPPTKPKVRRGVDVTPGAVETPAQV